MNSILKLVEKFVNEPDKITDDECCRLLEYLGYKEGEKPGSERIFHKKNSIAINVPRPKKSKYVKSPYIRRIIELLRLEDYLERD